MGAELVAATAALELASKEPATSAPSALLKPEAIYFSWRCGLLPPTVAKHLIQIGKLRHRIEEKNFVKVNRAC